MGCNNSAEEKEQRPPSEGEDYSFHEETGENTNNDNNYNYNTYANNEPISPPAPPLSETARPREAETAAGRTPNYEESRRREQLASRKASSARNIWQDDFYGDRNTNNNNNNNTNNTNNNYNNNDTNSSYHDENTAQSPYKSRPSVSSKKRSSSTYTRPDMPGVIIKRRPTEPEDVIVPRRSSVVNKVNNNHNDNYYNMANAGNDGRAHSVPPPMSLNLMPPTHVKSAEVTLTMQDEVRVRPYGDGHQRQTRMVIHYEQLNSE